MKVYFVRHAESIWNTVHRHQLAETPLSENGILQIGKLAERFTHIHPDIILSSPYTRTLQTAKAIEKVTSVPITTSELLIERQMPSLFLGKLLDDPEIADMHQSLRDHADEKDWHLSDEENYFDLVQRANKALEYIASLDKDTVVAVTHGYFLVVMITTLLFDSSLSYQQFRLFKENAAFRNTGITLCEYKNKKWKLLTWNDYAHLGE